jgi:hypothetical protein
MISFIMGFSQAPRRTAAVVRAARAAAVRGWRMVFFTGPPLKRGGAAYVQPGGAADGALPGSF